MHDDSLSSYRFPLTLLLAAVVAAVAWSWLALGHANIEKQGGDIVNHALIVRALLQGEPHDFGDYPTASHQLVVWLVPLFGGQVIQTMRCVALICLAVMLVSQYTLLRRHLPLALAILAVLAAQLLCQLLRIGNVNHFLWKGQYNYSRAVGAAAVWLLLALLATAPADRRRWWLTVLLALGLAAGSLACHVATGALGFGALGLYFGYRSLRTRQGQELAAALLTVLVFGGMILGTGVWQNMATTTTEGWLPIKYGRALVLSVVGALAALAWLGGRLRHRDSAAATDVGELLACALVVAVGFQSYLLVRLHCFGTVPLYAVKSVLFYSGALAVLFAADRLGAWTRHLLEGRWAWLPGKPWYSWSVRAAACAVTLAVLGQWLARDATRSFYGPDRDPDEVVQQLLPHRDELAGYVYFDPRQPSASFYASRAGLPPHPVAMSIAIVYPGDPDLPAFMAQGAVKGLVLPAGVSSPLLDQFPGRVHPFGPYVLWELMPKPN